MLLPLTRPALETDRPLSHTVWEPSPPRRALLANLERGLTLPDLPSRSAGQRSAVGRQLWALGSAMGGVTRLRMSLSRGCGRGLGGEAACGQGPPSSEAPEGPEPLQEQGFESDKDKLA